MIVLPPSENDDRVRVAAQGEEDRALSETAVPGTCRDFCLAAATAMFQDQAIRHVSYFRQDELIFHEFVNKDMVLRVRIDWIPESMVGK